ncbi:sensor histidine kinase [Nocardioides pocheonensis]|uniref:histidine kinase n=1 Tax=Nocardioides pocheonensis TaxID=661485 RepID=A0A3N0GZH8_9ACTN|nr:sensor histidine kinase [Nocardioides pocheonensis]RNM17512.1 sensor histidine kinase [Nocardioides pocheonensis]
MRILGERLRRDWWVLVVVVISVLGTVMRGVHDSYPHPSAWAGVLAFVAVVPLFWRDRWPELTVVANAAAVATYFAASPGFPDGPIYLSIFFATYAVATRRPPRTWIPYAGAALVAILAALLVREARVDSTSTLGTAARLIWFAMVDSAAAALAVALRSRRETRQEHVRRTATEERLRMAQDLHDGVGHGLAVIAMQAGVALHVLDRDPAAARRSLEAIRDTSRESLDSLRAELARLAPVSGDIAPRAPRNGLGDLDVLAERVRAGGVQVRLQGAAGPVPLEVDAVGYVVVQEALTNVLRHADASVADVRVRRTEDILEITVTDDGRAEAPAGEAGARLGIPGMRSRVEALGGTLEAGPLPERGFGVRAVLPLHPADEA